MCACERPRLPSPLSRTRLRFIVPAALAIALAPLAGDAAFARGNQGLRRIGGGSPPAGEQRYVPDEVIIEVGGDPSSPAIEQLARRHRLARLESLSFRLSGTTLYRWRIPDRRSVPTVVRAL